MKAITSLVAENAVVIRDTKRETIPAEDLVTGDLVELTLGQRCPADLRIISISPDCKFDRSLLTGESDPVGATVAPTSENALETRNLALMSTFLVQVHLSPTRLTVLVVVLTSCRALVPVSFSPSAMSRNGRAHEALSISRQRECGVREIGEQTTEDWRYQS